MAKNVDSRYFLAKNHIFCYNFTIFLAIFIMQPNFLASLSIKKSNLKNSNCLFFQKKQYPSLPTCPTKSKVFVKDKYFKNFLRKHFIFLYLCAKIE